MNKKIATEIKNLVMITIASVIYGIGISCFLDPNRLAPGGFTGIAVILNYLTNIETGTMYFLINAPVVLLGIWKFGMKFMAKTAYAIVTVSLFTNMFAPVGALTTDLWMAGLIGGALIAVGVGVIFKEGATTGGSDIIIKLLREKFRHMKTGTLFLISDVLIVSVSGIIFKDLNIVFYALATVVVCSVALDYVLYSGDKAKMVYIMTNHPHEIGKRLMHDLDVGVTYLQGKGGWTGADKEVVLCVVPMKMGPQVEEIVKTEDPKAFMIVTSASEIYGEGYKDFFDEVV